MRDLEIQGKYTEQDRNEEYIKGQEDGKEEEDDEGKEKEH